MTFYDLTVFGVITGVAAGLTLYVAVTLGDWCKDRLHWRRLRRRGF